MNIEDLQNAETDSRDALGSEASDCVVERGQEGRDSGGPEDGALDCGEHELLSVVGKEDRDLLPEARSGQECAGLESGGEGLPVEGEGSVGSLGRRPGEDLGEEVVSEDDGREARIQFDAGFQSILDSRTPVAHAEFAARASGKVDRDGMLVDGVSLAERGEAKGHYMWLDETFIAQLAEQMAPGDRLKCRLGHPGMFREDRRAVGYFSDLYKDGDKVRGKLNVFKAARNIPGLGDVAGWIFDMAEEANDMFGLSIVFTRDLLAEDAFIAENLVKDKKEGYSYFKSPDKKNTRNYPHVRLGKLEACDIVDSPAANANGLFGDSTANEVFAYITGLKEEIPTFVPPVRIDEIKAARSAYAAFAAGLETEMDTELTRTIVNNDGEEISVNDRTISGALHTEIITTEDGDTLTITYTSPVGDEFVDFESASLAAARLPRSVLVEESFDANRERELIAAAYRSNGVKPPWLRNPESWGLYEIVLKHADKRGAILSDDFLAISLEVCGFSEESQLLVDSMLEELDDAGDKPSDSVQSTGVACSEEVELSEEQVRSIIRNVVAEKARQYTGRLD